MRWSIRKVLGVGSFMGREENTRHPSWDCETPSTATGQKWFSWHGPVSTVGTKKTIKNSGLLRPPLRTHWPGVEVINWRWPIWWHMWDCDWWWNPSFEDIWGMGWRNATKKGALNRSRMKNCSVLTRFQHNPRLSVARPAWLKALVDNEVHVEKFHARTVQKDSPGLLRW